MERFTHSHCPICNSEDIKLEFGLKDHSISKEDFELFRCGQCTFLFTQNAPAATEIAAYYKSEDYISHSNTKKGFVNRAYHIVRNIMLGKKHRLITGLKTGNRLLDMGCGTGYFAHFMKERGFEVKGVEIDHDAREFGKTTFGLDIVAPDEMMTGEVTDKYDVITLWHVLEHIYDLDEYMKRLYDLLDDNGYLIIAVPNSNSYDAKHYQSFWAAYDVPIHLWHFTPDTLNRLAEKHKFKQERLESLPFDPFYISMLSAKYKKTPMSILQGGIIGFISFLKGSMNSRNASSPIYVFKKSN